MTSGGPPCWRAMEAAKSNQNRLASRKRTVVRISDPSSIGTNTSGKSPKAVKKQEGKAGGESEARLARGQHAPRRRKVKNMSLLPRRVNDGRQYRRGSCLTGDCFHAGKMP